MTVVVLAMLTHRRSRRRRSRTGHVAAPSARRRSMRAGPRRSRLPAPSRRAALTPGDRAERAGRLVRRARPCAPRRRDVAPRARAPSRHRRRSRRNWRRRCWPSSAAPRSTAALADVARPARRDLDLVVVVLRGLRRARRRRRPSRSTGPQQHFASGPRLAGERRTHSAQARMSAIVMTLPARRDVAAAADHLAFGAWRRRCRRSGSPSSPAGSCSTSPVGDGCGG